MHGIADVETTTRYRLVVMQKVAVVGALVAVVGVGVVAFSVVTLKADVTDARKEAKSLADQLDTTRTELKIFIDSSVQRAVSDAAGFYCAVGMYGDSASTISMHFTACWRTAKNCSLYSADRGCVRLTSAWCPTTAGADDGSCAFEQFLCTRGGGRPCVIAH